MSKKHRRRSEITDSNKAGGGLSPIRSGPLLIQHAPGRPDVLELSVDALLAPPEKAAFIDHVRVERVRDGVRMLFCKLHPTNTGGVTTAVEVSMPLLAFFNQLYKSLVTPKPTGASFHKMVEEAVPKYGYDRISEMGSATLPEKLAASFRSNFAYVALHHDDAAVDFFHVDAATVGILSDAMQAGAQQAAGLQKIQAGVKGILRVVLSPPVLLFFIDECVKIAEVLKKTMPSIDAGSLQSTRITS